MFILSITPNDIGHGINDCTAYYNYGGSSFPEKKLIIESNYPIFFIEDGKKNKEIYWRNDQDANHARGYLHDIVILLDTRNIRDIVEITLEESDGMGHTIKAFCLLHLTT